MGHVGTSTRVKRGAPTWTSCSVEGETSISFRVTPKLPFRLVSLTCCCSKGTKYLNVSSTPRIRRAERSSSTGTSKPTKAATRFCHIGFAAGRLVASFVHRKRSKAEPYHEAGREGNRRHKHHGSGQNPGVALRGNI